MSVMGRLIAGRTAAMLAAWGLLAAPAAAQALAAGVYDALIIGVDPATHTVTGYYFSETGQGQYSCIFYLKGKLAGSRAAIATYFPETPGDVIRGELLAGAGGGIRIRLPTEHGGCWNVQHFADNDQPADFTLEAGHPWTSVAVVKSAKAYFYDTPASSTRRKGYVVKGDGVGVRAERPGWLAVDYLDPDGKVASGWIRQADVYPRD